MHVLLKHSLNNMKVNMNVIKLFIDMDKMMGDTYNKGLAKLKTICEKN